MTANSSCTEKADEASDCRSARRHGRRRRRSGFVVLSLLAGIGAVGALHHSRFELARLHLGLPGFTHRPGSFVTQWVPMGDGVRLSTQIRLPAGDGPWPVVLMRNPYDPGGRMGQLCQMFPRYGYGCVHQSVRGRMKSEGRWEPLANEREDGLDTLAWLNEQPWQDGNVALFGPSYLAATQWAVADSLPPQVKTIIPLHFGTDFRDAAFERGLFRHEILTAWTALMPDASMRYDLGAAYQKAVSHRPHIEVDEVLFGSRLPWYREWLGAVDPAASLWQREDVARFRTAPSRTTVPVLMTNGWYDPFLRTSLATFQELASRGQSKLLIGPWDHMMQSDDDLEDPGDLALGARLGMVFDWLGHHLKGERLDQTASGVETYVPGEGRWRQRADWPPKGRPERLFLANADAARSCQGGTLATAPTAIPESISYRYDPDDPVPTRGGAGLLAFCIHDFGGARPGSVEQGDLCERQDVLSFVTPALEEDLHIAGSIRVTLFVRSDAPDTAFTAKLVEIKPDGTALNIRDGATSLAYREGGASASPYRPGKVARVDLELWPMEWRLRSGSRLRLDVSSSNFPAYHAHTNQAGPWASQDEAVTTLQTLLVGGDHASFVELPLWSDPSLPVIASVR